MDAIAAVITESARQRTADRESMSQMSQMMMPNMMGMMMSMMMQGMTADIRQVLQ